jgi:UDP-N-acetylglucosamine--N-acetylmuramyl-(pentapeptide) pyrophosphoryl-undecaprenol N-acetylglucosamine transferase
LYPALALAAELRERHPLATIWFIGARRGLEQRLVPQAGYRLRSLGVSGIKGRGGIGKLVAAVSAGWAVCRCAMWLLASRPDLVIGVGGYASGPAMLAASHQPLAGSAGRRRVCAVGRCPATAGRARRGHR